MDMWILNAHGEPVHEPDLERWAHWMADPHARRVAWTVVGDWTVSTVFLGISHSFGLPPVLWETMVFGPEPWSGASWRYTSHDAALAEHDQIAEHLRRGGSPAGFP